MACRGVRRSPGKGARSLLTWGIDLWPYINGKALVNGLNLKEMDASDMLDVIHFFFEEDMNFASKEEADARSNSREIIYQDFYDYAYRYGSSKSTSSTASQGRYYIEEGIEESEESIVPFDPLKGPTKAFVPATPVDASMSKPFGAVLDEPLSR